MIRTNGARIRRAARRDVAAPLAGVLGIVLVSAVLRPFRGDINTVVVALAYLSAVLLVATRTAPWVAIATALLAFTAFDFFFIPPYDTLRVDRSGDGLALLSFAIVSVAASEATVLLRQRARQAEERERSAMALSAFSTLLLTETSAAGLPASVTRSAAQLLDADECVILPARDNDVLLPVEARIKLPNFLALEPARRSLQAGSPLMVEAEPRSPGVRTLYLPLVVENRVLGVLVASGRLREYDGAQGQGAGIAAAVAHTLAVTLDRERLTEETAHLEALRRAEEFKTILLAALSHDLKTPIAAIKATVTGLLGAEAQWDEDGRRAALRAVDDATDRLNHLVTGLLDLSRIEAGAVHPRIEPCDLQDLAGSALETVGSLLDDRQVAVSLPEDLPLIDVDFVLMAQVLVNLLDNAARYTGSGARIEIHARASTSEVIISVWDDGPGIAPAEREHVFEKFYRASSAAGAPPSGAGLGLAICRGLVDRHGGQIWAERSPLGGAAISFSVPRLPEQHAPKARVHGHNDSGR